MIYILICLISVLCLLFFFVGKCHETSFIEHYINTTGEIEVFLHILDIYSVCIFQHVILIEERWRERDANLLRSDIMTMSDDFRPVIKAQTCVWLFHGEWSHRRVDGQTPLAASLEVKGGTGVGRVRVYKGQEVK